MQKKKTIKIIITILANNLFPKLKGYKRKAKNINSSTGSNSKS